jgi:hypothetical protein
MSVFRKATNSESQPSLGRYPAVGVNRLARFVGRVLLWGCVLLLLVRGAMSYLHTEARTITTRGVTVTVTQPAKSVPSNREGK